MEEDTTVLKISVRNYSIMSFCMVSIGILGLPILYAESMSTSTNDGIGEIRIVPASSYISNEKTEDYEGTVRSLHVSDSKPISGIFAIQFQSNTTTPESANNFGQSTVTNSSKASNSEDTGSMDLPNNNNSPDESTDQRSTSTQNSSPVKCNGVAICVTGEVVKVVNGKAFYVNIQNKVYPVQLALIELPVNNEEAMRAATTFTRNTCLGSTVLIDQDDAQRENSLIAQVYCSPTKNLNALLLETGYVLLDNSQCQISEFSTLSWAKSHGC